MKPWLWTSLCLGCLALAGCRANSHRTLLEQESRQWEDRFYVVKDRLDQCQTELCAARQKNRELEESSGDAGSSSLHDSPILPGLMGKSSGGKARRKGKPGGPLAPPNIGGMSSDRFQKIEPDTPQMQTPEQIKPGELADPDSVAPPFEPGASKKSTTLPADVMPGSEAPPYKPPASSEPNRLINPVLPPGTNLRLPGNKSAPNPGLKKGSNLSDDSSEVARIELIEMPTDGFDSDNRPGDDGVQFVLQPRDSNGKTVAVTGPISIVVVDPLPEGKSVRLARWDLTPDQAAGYHDSSPSGFHLRLPWTGATPKHSRLRLFARFTTADGRKVQAEKAITVVLPGQQAPSWSLDPPPQLSKSPATQQSPTTPRSTLTIQPPPTETPKAQPQSVRPRVAAQPQPRPTKPRRKRPVWSPDRL